jgi:hypothetical protein
MKIRIEKLRDIDKQIIPNIRQADSIFWWVSRSIAILSRKYILIYFQIYLVCIQIWLSLLTSRFNSKVYILLY